MNKATKNQTTIAKKQNEVQAIVEKINAAGSIVFVDYLGLSVAEVTELRKKLHAENCEMKVVKNNILRRTSSIAGYEGTEKYLVGPSAIVTSPDEVTAAKLVYEFLKGHEKLSVKAGIVDGSVLEEPQLKALSSLPNKDGMISMLLSVLQAPIRGLACAIKAVSEKE